MDKQIIQDQINGITSRITTLRKDRDVHVRLQGLNVEAEKLRTEALDYSNQIEKEKVTISALLAQRQQIVQSTIVGLSKRMAKIIPVGRPDIQITEDGGVYIGWVRPDGKKVAYAGLSGGEKALFDPALAFASKRMCSCRKVRNWIPGGSWSPWRNTTGRRFRSSSRPATPRQRSQASGRRCGYEP